MSLRCDDETEAFRAELRAWLASNLPTPEERRAQPVTRTTPRPAWALAWQRRLFDAGWLVPGWSPEHGGRGASPVQQLVCAEELARIDVPRSLDPQGPRSSPWAAPSSGRGADFGALPAFKRFPGDARGTRRRSELHTLRDLGGSSGPST